MLDTTFGKFVLRLGSLRERISEDDYFEICQLNELLVIERNQNGDWEIQSINGGTDGARSAKVTSAVGAWANEDGTGIGFGAFTGFTLPNGAVRAPDCAWVRKQRWKALTRDQVQKFAPICPELAVEIRAKHESVADLHTKLEEYIANGSQLGWLIDPFEKRIYVYRPRLDVEVLENPETVSGEPLLKGFVLNVQSLWS